MRPSKWVILSSTDHTRRHTRSAYPLDFASSLYVPVILALAPIAHTAPLHAVTHAEEPSSEAKVDAFARRFSELLLGRVVEVVVLQAAASRCTHPSDIGTWAQSMRRTMVAVMAGRLCALVAESGCIQKGWKGERGGIQKGREKASMEASRR